jgi:hypothetical protein
VQDTLRANYPVENVIRTLLVNNAWERQ